MIYDVLPCFHVYLELPWVPHEGWRAEADTVLPVMDGPGTLDEKMVLEP